MQLLANPLKLTTTSRKNELINKRTIGADDLEIVADLISDGIREGLYADIFPTTSRAEIVQFLRHLVTRCEYRGYDPLKKCFYNRTAALLIYAVEGTVVGFSVLAQSLSASSRNCVDLIMLGIVPLQRGMGYGASILDEVIKSMSEQYFNLVVKCPSDNQLLFGMLAVRGFLTVGRVCKDRLLRLTPLLKVGRSRNLHRSSRHAE